MDGLALCMPAVENLQPGLPRSIELLDHGPLPVRFVVVDGACDDRAHAILGKPGIDTLSLQYVGAPGGGRVTTASGDSVPLVQARHVHASAAVAAHGPHACRHCGWTGNSRNALFKHVEAAHDPDCRCGAQHRCGHGGCTHV